MVKEDNSKGLMSPVDEVDEEELLAQLRRPRAAAVDPRLRHSMIDMDYSKRHSDPLLEAYFILEQEPKQKRRRSLARVTSLANLLSPVKPIKKVGHALQRSLSWKNLASPTPSNGGSSKIPRPATPYRPPPPTPPKRRQSIYWHETAKGQNATHLDRRQLERQEAIYELYKSDEDLLEDLQMVDATYHNSMRRLGLMSEAELEQIFGNIDMLVPVHEELVCALKEQRLPDGSTENVGKVLLDWLPRLEVYSQYCANQVYAKALLDFKKQDPAVEDFLERCLESPFSRHLDLWSFLDYPRSRLVKYPLLFKSIQKLTPEGHEDIELIDRACSQVEEIISNVDKNTGKSKCSFTQEKLDYIDEKQRHPMIEESNVILCDGVLKNNRGTKLYVFLFEKVLVLTRPATRGGQLKYQVYRQPIPINQLVVEDIKDGQKMGSFKSAFTQGQTSKNVFKVSFYDIAAGQSHTLQANDEHDKRQWVQCLNGVVPSKEEMAATAAEAAAALASQAETSETGPSSDLPVPVPVARTPSPTPSMTSLSSVRSIFRRSKRRKSITPSIASVGSSSSAEAE